MNAFPMNLIRFFFISVFFSFVFISCKSGGSKKIARVTIDTFKYVAPAPGDISQQDFDRYHTAVKNYYDNELVNKGFNGGILVAKKGRVVFEAYHGFFNLRKKDSLTRHSPFHLASVSKTFTAMATLKLVEMGKLSLDDDVKKFFPGFPYDNVTVRLLLSHRSGLPNYIYFMEKLGWNRKQYCSNLDVLSYLIQYKPNPTSRPNTHFEYCNTNYALLGLIIEKASGKSYADFLQTVFFTPLHMNDTYLFNRFDSATAMPSYNNRGRQEGLTFLDTGFGDKNIYSTPEDLLKWDQSMYGNQMFTQKTLDEAFTPYSNEKPGIRNYGFGWRMNVYPDGRKIIYHNGWWHGNNAVFIRLIQDSATIIVLGNKYNPYIYRSKKMAEIFEPSSVMEDDEKPGLGNNNYNTASTDSIAPAKKIHHSAKKMSAKKIRRRKK